MQTLTPPILEPLDTIRNMDANMAVAVYSTHTEAEIAIKALEQSGFDMTKLSIVGRDYHTEERVTG